MNQSKFDVKRQRRIVKMVRRGAFMRDAAEAVGISRQTLINWLRSGEPQYAKFQRTIRRARALARFEAGTLLYDQNPRAWLMTGPGRERYGTDGMLLEGWSSASPKPPSRPESPNLFHLSSFLTFLRMLEHLRQMAGCQEGISRGLKGDSPRGK